MLKQTLKWLDIVLAFFLTLILATVLGVYAWVSYEPRDLTQQIPAILKELNIDLASKGYELKMDSAILRNGGFSKPLELSVKEVQLKTPEGQTLLHIPELRVGPSLVAFLQGKIFPYSVDVMGADFAILQDGQGAFYLDTREGAPPVKLSNLFFDEHTAAPVSAKEDEAFSFEHLFAAGIGRINISDASVEYKSELTGFSLKLANVFAHIDSVLLSEQVKGGVNASYENSQKQPALFQSTFHYDNAGQKLELDVNVHNLIPAQFAAAGAGVQDLSKIPYPLSGNIHTELTLPEAIDKANFDLSSKELAGLHLRGDIDGSFAQPHVIAKGEMGSFDLPFLKAHWPEGVGKDAYRWINDSIRQASVDKAEIQLDVSAKDLRLPELPKKAVNVVLHIHDAVIDYTKGFPAAKQASGRVYFEGQSLRAEIDEVAMLSSTRLQPTRSQPKATVKIPDLMQDNIKILIDVPLRAGLGDVLSFMQATPYKLPPSLPLSAAAAKGFLQGVLSMQVLDQISPLEDEVDFQLDGHLQNVAYAGLTVGVDLSDLNGEIKASNGALDLSLDGKFNQKPFDAAVQLGGEEDRETYRYSGYLPMSVLALGVSDIKPYVSGAATVDAKWQDDSINLTADLREMEYRVPTLKLSKAAGATARLEAKGKVKGDIVSLSSASYSDGRAAFSGAASFNQQSGALLSSRIDNLSFGKTRMKGSYALKSGKHEVNLTGSMLDLEPLLAKPEPDKKEEPGKTFLQRLIDIPDMSANVTFDTIRFAEDRQLQDSRLLAECQNGRCSKFELDTRTGETGLTARIGATGDKRNFTMSTPDLGRFLRVTGMFDDMRDGVLNISAVYQDELPNAPMAGRAVLENFSVRNVPLLAKLLTMATFTGILDTLSGSGGLSFQKMVLPFQYDPRKLVIKDAKAAGPSIGITANGVMDIEPNQMDIEGAVIPAKLFDTVLSSIPLIGNVYDALTGGEGLVAMNYHIKGNADDPSVTVNPLSVLTPGFLRGVFEIFDPSKAKNAQDSKAAGEALKELEPEIKATEEENKPAAEVPAEEDSEPKGTDINAQSDSGTETQPPSVLRKKR